LIFPHKPVLAVEVIEALVTRPEGAYIDGTMGAGGHSELIRRNLRGKGKLLGIDRDAQILNIARDRLQSFGGGCAFLHGSYEDLEQACRLLGVSQVDGILLDLGVSSLQLDQGERGFSFSKEGPLDMRMDLGARETGQETAKTIVEERSLKTLERILKEFGEEPHASRIAQAIVHERRHRSINTTTELAAIVARAIPRRAWPSRIHPATRTFQALRIATNRELERLQNFLDKSPHFLVSGGRLVIMSYHSLEDRLVKRSFLQRKQEGVMKIITKKPIQASEDEIRENPRSRSVKMRVAEKMEGLS